MRTWLLALALLPATAAAARADVIPLDAPAEYHPGGTFQVHVGLPPLQALAAYSLDVIIRSEVPLAGLLSIDLPVPSASGYVFGAAAALLTSSVTASTFEYRVRLGDSFPGVNRPDVVAGVNDRVSDLTVRVSPEMTGRIRAFIDQGSVFFDASGGSEIPIEVNSPRIIAQGSPEVTSSPVPAPPGLLLAVVGGVVIAGRRLTRGKK